MKNTIQTNTPANQKDYWRTTEQAYRDACDLCGVDDFDADVAASAGNSKCFYRITEQEDSMRTSWFYHPEIKSAWCNPPFSRKVEFIQKAYTEGGAGLVCMMLPYEPCTAWWRNNVDGKATVVYVPDGRYNFCHPETGKEIKGVNFASAFVVFTGLTMPTQYVQFKRGLSSE